MDFGTELKCGVSENEWAALSMYYNGQGIMRGSVKEIYSSARSCKDDVNSRVTSSGRKYLN